MKGQSGAVILALGLRKVNWKRWEKDLTAKGGDRLIQTFVGNTYMQQQGFSELVSNES
jgi:hypothetical protein